VLYNVPSPSIHGRGGGGGRSKAFLFERGFDGEDKLPADHWYRQKRAPSVCRRFSKQPGEIGTFRRLGLRAVEHI
jgi:hypothetical protein